MFNDGLITKYFLLLPIIFFVCEFKITKLLLILRLTINPNAFISSYTHNFVALHK